MENQRPTRQNFSRIAVFFPGDLYPADLRSVTGGHTFPSDRGKPTYDPGCPTAPAYNAEKTAGPTHTVCAGVPVEAIEGGFFFIAVGSKVHGFPFSIQAWSVAQRSLGCAPAMTSAALNRIPKDFITILPLAI